ncbi:MAG: methyl-accepting chemotaxis protein [Desulfuromonadales bacterium]|nr:methyl-accepting chemotaxis protein [Desulfuromonadales bacterium]
MLPSLSLRWKILLAMLGLSLASVTIILVLFSSMVEQQQREKNDQLADLSGKFVVQSLLDYEQVLRTQLPFQDITPQLVAAIDAAGNRNDPTELQLVLQRLHEQYGLVRSELQLPNGRLYLLESNTANPLLQKLQLSKEQVEQKPLSARPAGWLRLNGATPGIDTSLPLMLESRIVGRLTVSRQIDDSLAEQLGNRLGMELAFHNGQDIVAASRPELKRLSLPAIRQGLNSVLLGETSHSIRPLDYDADGHSGLLLIADQTRHQELGTDFRKNMIFAAVAVMLLATLVALILSRNISGPLHQVVNTLQELTAGKVSLRTLPNPSRSEAALISANLALLREHLDEDALNTRATISRLNLAIDRMRSHAANVSDNAGTQVTAMEKAQRAINEIGNASTEIAEHVTELVASVQESAAASHQFGSTTLSIARQMEHLFAAVSEISTTIQQLSTSNEKIDQNINILHGGARETVIAIELLEQATGRIEAGARQSSERAEEAAVQALDGKAAMQDTIRGISGLQQLIEQAHRSILDLGNRSDTIGNIVNVIADVADQTNLLALNAAIIAAQAGDQGQGFAVVADEIRNLSERTTTSAGEITEIIANLQSGTRTAVTAIEAGSERAKQEVAHAHAAGKILEKLHQGALESTDQVRSIVEQTLRQSLESRKITEAATGISGMLEQIAGAMREQTESTRQMSGAAQAMTDIAARVKLSTDEQSRGGQQIAEGIEHIQHMIEQIDSATQHLKLRSGQVIDAVSAVHSIAEKNADRANEMSEGIETLSVQAGKLQKPADRDQRNDC